MRGLKKRLLLVGMSIFFILGAFVGCGSSEKEDTSNVAKGYQWKVEKDGKELYLIGTMHPINTSYDYFSDKILEIMKETDVLSVEVNMSQEDMLLANARLVYSDGKTIENELSKEQIKTLKELCSDAGIDYEKLKVFKAQGVIQNISAVIYEKANLEMATFDDMLKDRYIKENKKVDQVENMEFQLNLMDKIQGIDQLKEMLDEYEKGKFEDLTKEETEYAKNVMESYKNGDEKFMNEAIEMQKENEDIYKALILDRNIGMVKKIEEYIKSDEKYALAVGALHFFGDDGIIKILEDKGYKITKL